MVILFDRCSKNKNIINSKGRYIPTILDDVAIAENRQNKIKFFKLFFSK